MNDTAPLRTPVISTAAGQPPIGKPLIVQARGQLRLTWRLYAESPQSGEISRLRVSIEPTTLPTHTDTKPRSNGWEAYHQKNNKGAVKK